MDMHFEVLPKGRRITFSKGDRAAGVTVHFGSGGEVLDRGAAERRAREEAVALWEGTWGRIEWSSATVIAANASSSVTVELIVRNW